MHRIALLAPMTSELAAVRRAGRLARGADDPGLWQGAVAGSDVVATLIGIGPVPAAAATRALIARVPCDHVAVVGVAGAIDPALRIGDLVVPTQVRDHASGATADTARLAGVERRGVLVTTGELLTPDALLPLAAQGVVAVDMEAAAVGAVCAEAGVPWSVFRGISDVVGDAAVDERILRLTRPDGSADLGAVARFVAGDPRRIRTLARLGSQLSSATRVAAEAAVAAVPAMAAVSGA